MRVSTRFLAAIALAGAISLHAGCKSETATAPSDAPASGEAGHSDADGHNHGHPEEGPHKGHLIELGKEEYHAELTHDEATGEVTIYVLDGVAKEAVPVAETELAVNLVSNGKPMQFVLPASPQASDPQGQSSKFSVTDKSLLEALEAEGAKGQLNITINGKPYSGTIEHHEHEEEKH
jgi:hypothetical protein